MKNSFAMKKLKIRRKMCSKSRNNSRELFWNFKINQKKDIIRIKNGRNFTNNYSTSKKQIQ